MKLFTSKNQKIGELGENIACRFLKNRGFEILERNYTRRYGEIDIVAKYSKIIHFVEVKTVSCEITDATLPETVIRPEENMHERKLHRFQNTVHSYLANNEINDGTPWQIDLVCVYLDLDSNKARVNILENIL
ncbi:MAG: YraN family protein [Candidatus Pacebacteria bacterium]|jgi:putative endonuclease|nr:YraN family protein [Candidatus Paceibacterota bacterium]